MDTTFNIIADNDVNGLFCIIRGIASGRNGSEAIQVVNQRKSKNREDKVEQQLFGCKDATYFGTWNVRTLYSAGQLDLLLHQLRGVRWSIMGLPEVTLRAPLNSVL